MRVNQDLSGLGKGDGFTCILHNALIRSSQVVSSWAHWAKDLPLCLKVSLPLAFWPSLSRKARNGVRGTEPWGRSFAQGLRVTLLQNISAVNSEIHPIPKRARLKPCPSLTRYAVTATLDAQCSAGFPQEHRWSASSNCANEVPRRFAYTACPALRPTPSRSRPRSGCNTCSSPPIIAIVSR
jgi:hypothetical protein